MPEELIELLERRAQSMSESLNALAVRLLSEGLRGDEHPLVYFRTGASGIRRPTLLGTRLDIWQVISTLRTNDNDLGATADHLSLSDAQVRAAVQYYADYADEIDAHIADEQEYSARARERWKRSQQVLSA